LLAAWAGHDPDHGDEEQACRVETARRPTRHRVKERASGLLPVAPTLLRLALVARAQVPGICGPVRIAAFATMFHRGWITRRDRPDLSAVRSSSLPDEPAPEIFMAMQGDHAS
jgi:hypothetical protein